MAKQHVKIGIGTALILLALAITLVAGWGMNILDLVQTEQMWPLTGLTIVRLIGIFVFPIGALAGLFT